MPTIPFRTGQQLDQVVALSQSEMGRKRTREIIRQHGGILYEAAPDGRIMERSPDGKSRVGRFVNRQFVAED